MVGSASLRVCRVVTFVGGIGLGLLVNIWCICGSKGMILFVSVCGGSVL